jgi:hypothetical protein
MTLGQNNWNPYHNIEGIYPCIDPEIDEFDCKDCLEYPNCTYSKETEIPIDKMPFPAAVVGKTLVTISGRSLSNGLFIDSKPTITNRNNIRTGKLPSSVTTQQFLNF